jgi:exopolysaccharide biosynthesis polyprenyl glycosylphosphotransferase
MVALFLLDIAIVQIALWFAIELRFILPFGANIAREWSPEFLYSPGWGMYLAVGLLWMSLFISSSVYVARRIIYWFDEFQRIFLAHTTAALSLAGLLYMARLELPRLTYIYFYVLSLATILGIRLSLRVWHRFYSHSYHNVARILVVGAGKTGRRLVEKFAHYKWPGIELVGYLDDDSRKHGQIVLDLPVLGRVDQAASIIRQYEVDEVLIALPSYAHDRLANLVVMLQEQPVRVRVVPDYFELAFFGATVESLGGIPLIGLRDPAIDGLQRFVKRLFDVTLSAALLTLLSPVLAIVALAIKLEDGGPIFYRAGRVGENGRLFSMLKFRSMLVDADKMQWKVNATDEQGNVIHKRVDDPRITKVGRIIRRTSIDELPQLVNVLKGDMSLVGPRPELPWLVEKYEPWQRKRFAVPQGITGWWQINGRSDNLMHLHTDQDLYYIQNYSLWLDLQILWRTLNVVLRGKGAY